jgi:hypothetical protein
MTCLAVEPAFSLSPPDKWDAVRVTVFWAFILLVIVSPAVLGACILIQV